MMVNRLYHILRLLTIAAVALTAASCSEEDHIILNGGSSSSNSPGGTPGSSASASAGLAARLEVPAMKSGNQLLAHWSVEGEDSVMTYCLEYDRSKYHSRWVAFRFDDHTRGRNVGRKDYGIKPQYPADPQLPADAAIEDDASFTGYQHGHLCASADRLYSRTANDNTFYMTNMSPQLGNFNGKYWAAFETLVQKIGRDKSFADTLYVVKGGTIADGQVEKYVAGERIAVPKYYFMALLKVKNGAYNSIAFWMEHKDYGSTTPDNTEMASRAISVDELEELTGIDFFHNLPDNIETAVEQLCLPTAWGM